MSKDSNSNDQNFFQLIDAVEQADIFEFISNKKNSIFIKDVTNKNASAQLTEVAVHQYKNSLIKGRYKNGPSLGEGTEITLTFDQASAKFFAGGTLISEAENIYEISLKKLFKLQRRDSFRVTIPKIIMYAAINISGKNFTLIDLSAGGCAFQVPVSEASLFEMGSLVTGNLSVGTSEPVDVSFKVKFRRKNTYESKEFLHIGAEFTDTSLVFNQKMQSLVYECQRQIIISDK
ncbi:MAG: PilZ domain-containing protein [Oligoflexia bacterium]|nr:PilZ domain-containing protein [Oligoflexia bacterium]